MQTKRLGYGMCALTLLWSFPLWACGDCTVMPMPDIGVDGGRESDACAAGLSLCGTSCVDRTNDRTNCGVCGRVCGASTMCLGSACRPDRRLEFILDWDFAGDVDLHVVRPDGVEISFRDSDPAVGPGGLDGDLDVDDTTSRGPERIAFDVPTAGDYFVCVNPFDIDVRTTWRLRVRESGTLIDMVTGSESTSDGSFRCSETGADLTYSFAP